MHCSRFLCCGLLFSFFFFHDTATTEIYTLSLHDALPISNAAGSKEHLRGSAMMPSSTPSFLSHADRKSTRLNSSHVEISYAVCCLKKKKKITIRSNNILAERTILAHRPSLASPSSPVIST